MLFMLHSSQYSSHSPPRGGNGLQERGREAPSRGPLIGAQRVPTEDGALGAGDEATATVLPTAAAEHRGTPGMHSIPCKTSRVAESKKEKQPHKAKNKSRKQ